MTDSSRDAYYRRSFAQQHLHKKSLEAAEAIDKTLRDLAAHCRSTAYLETETARRNEFASVADGLEDAIESIRTLSSRAWAATRSDWTNPAATDAAG